MLKIPKFETYKLSWLSFTSDDCFSRHVQSFCILFTWSVTGIFSPCYCRRSLRRFPSCSQNLYSIFYNISDTVNIFLPL